MSRVIVVTGTDTDVGKTMVTAGLSRALRARGVDVRAVKPVESGTPVDVALSEDGVRLAQAAGQAEPRHALVRLREPLAPPLAADIDGVTLDMGAWCDAIREVAADAELTLVEGAGGLLSPLTWAETARDLAIRLNAEVLVVAADALGTLSHTLLVLEALQVAGRSVVGVVYSAPEHPDTSTGGNAETLRRFAGIQRVATLPRVTDDVVAAEHLSAVGDWLMEPEA